LTDEIFSRRLKDLMTFKPGFEIREIELLKTGRHFRLGPDTKVIVGRNKDENDAIASLSRGDDFLMTTPSVPGPDVLITGATTPETEALAASITVSYSDAKTGETQVKIRHRGEDRSVTASGRGKEEFKSYMI